MITGTINNQASNIDLPLKGKIAVTGATGLVGSHLIAELIRCGYKYFTIPVRSESSLSKLYDVLKREEVDIKDITLDVHETSLTNPIRLKNIFKNVQTVFHCAAMVAIGGMDENSLIKTNTGITSHVVNACLECDVDKLIHVSSIATINSSHYKDAPADESYSMTALPTGSGYAISKLMSENEVIRGAALGLKTIMVNPAPVLGIGGSQNGSASIIPLLSKQISVYTKGVTCFVDVKDVAKAMVMLAESGKGIGEKFILSAQNISYYDLISMANEITGHKPPRYSLGYVILRIASYADNIIAKLSGRRPLLTKEMARILNSKNYYSGDKIKKTINFDYTPLKETILRLISQQQEQS